MKNKSDQSLGEKIVLGIFLLLIITPFYFYVIEPYQDSKEISKMVCNDLGLKMIDRNIILKDISNERGSDFIKSFYKVECSNKTIYSYEPYRYINWKYEDCSIIDKWGECKNLLIGKRIKSIGYNLE